jgi:hypothetical protein
MRIMRAMGWMAAMLLTAMMAGGCISVAGVQKHERRVVTASAQRVIQAQATRDGAMVGVDLLALDTGYFAAWRAMPGEMALRTVGDIGVTAAAAWAGYEAAKQLGWVGSDGEGGGGGGNTSSSSTSSSTVEDRSIIYNMYGSGNIIGDRNTISGGQQGDQTTAGGGE